MSYPSAIRKEGELVMHYLDQLTDGFGWKTLVSLAGTLVTAISGFYTDMIWGFLTLVALDFISGILKSLKNNVQITSRRLRDSVVKLAGYLILVGVVILLSKHDDSLAPVVTWVYYYFMFTEGKSILENVQEMGVKMPPFLIPLVSKKIKDTEEAANATSTEEGTNHKKEGEDKDAKPN
ncbi:Holin family protein [compost metagenome]